MKTNAARLLDSLGTAYSLRQYDLGAEEFSGVAVAGKIGLPVEQVFKTLVAETEKGEAVFAVIPVAAELDFKMLASAAGAKKTRMVAVKEIEPLTGYVRGGVTVFAAKNALRVFIDGSVELIDTISVSAGARGVQIVIRAADFIHAAGRISPVTVAALTKGSAPASVSATHLPARDSRQP